MTTGVKLKVWNESIQNLVIFPVLLTTSGGRGLVAKNQCVEQYVLFQILKINLLIIQSF